MISAFIKRSENKMKTATVLLFSNKGGEADIRFYIANAK